MLRGHGSAVTALVPAPPMPAAAEAEAAPRPAEEEAGEKKNRKGAAARRTKAPPPPHAANPAALRLVSAGRDGVVVIWDWLSRSKSAEIAAMEAVEGAALVGFSASSSTSPQPPRSLRAS